MYMSEKDVCPYCNGRGMKVLVQKEQVIDGRPMSNEASVPCICSLNAFVSAKYKRLSGIDNVTASDCINVAKKLAFMNAVFHGPESLFLYVLKCFLVIHFPFNRRFAVVTGADIAEKYAMAQPNGVIPTVDLLTDLDLVAVLCVARVNNKAIGPGTQEVIANRLRTKKATWAYSPDESSLLASKEFAPDEGHGSGEDLVSGWPIIHLPALFSDLDGFDASPRSSARKSQSIAADL
jgi:hypothetical protein